MRTMSRKGTNEYIEAKRRAADPAAPNRYFIVIFQLPNFLIVAVP
jgi:hypothetical protein